MRNLFRSGPPRFDGGPESFNLEWPRRQKYFSDSTSMHAILLHDDFLRYISEELVEKLRRFAEWAQAVTVNADLYVLHLGI